MTMQAEATMVVKLGYRGAAYSGFAEQKDSAVRTVAGEVRRALELILRREVELVCAGRTDAGVHAIAQYVSLPVFGDELALDGRRVVHSLVGITPDDIAIYGLYRSLIQVVDTLTPITAASSNNAPASSAVAWIKPTPAIRSLNRR